MRAAYRDIELYDPRRTPCEIDLSDNTNLFGAPPSVARVLASAASGMITRYPSVYADALRRALAALHGVAPENVTTGCGSDGVLDSALRAFCEPGDSVAYPDPTFLMVPTYARMNGARPLPIPTHADFSIDAAALRAPIVYVCSPNNPTGTVTTRAHIASIKSMVLLDEAYASFSDDDHAVFAASSNNTISLRTLSKAWGMAGLRIGYAIGPAPLIREIEKARGPYMVNAIAEAAALSAIANDRAWVNDAIAQVTCNRTRLTQILDARRIRYVPSQANFVLIALPDGWTAEAMNIELRKRGVAVRPFTQLPHIGECIRVTIGPWAMVERFLTAYSEVLS